MELQLDSAVDQPILTALRTGQHRRAATLMVNSYGPAVHRVCRLVASAELGDDLTYACFARAFGAFETFRVPDSPRAWLLEITHARCLEQIDVLRGERALTVAEATAEFRGDPSADPETVRASYEKLEDLWRAGLGLFLAEALGPADIASRLGIDAASFERLLLRSLADLAAELLPADADADASDAPSEDSPAAERYPRLIASLRHMRWRPGASLARRLDVLAAAL